MDSIWLLYTCVIQTSRLNNSPIIAENIANQIRWEITSVNKCYPGRELGKRTRLLNLDKFLASHELGSIIRWTTFSSSTKLDF